MQSRPASPGVRAKIRPTAASTSAVRVLQQQSQERQPERPQGQAVAGVDADVLVGGDEDHHVQDTGTQRQPSRNPGPSPGRRATGPGRARPRSPPRSRSSPSRTTRRVTRVSPRCTGRGRTAAVDDVGSRAVRRRSQGWRRVDDLGPVMTSIQASVKTMVLPPRTAPAMRARNAHLVVALSVHDLQQGDSEVDDDHDVGPFTPAPEFGEDQGPPRPLAQQEAQGSQQRRKAPTGRSRAWQATKGATRGPSPSAP